MNCSLLKTIIVLCGLMNGGIVSAAPLDKVQFIKIAPRDQKAVIKTADGKLQVIKPSDLIGDTVTVKEIATGRIVLEEKTDKGLETVIVRMVNDKARNKRGQATFMRYKACHE